MRTLLLIISVLIMSQGVTQAQDWQLVWSDEFDYQGLPDPKKWDYEVGFVRNHEKQYYTQARLENARVENGMLVIEGRKEKFANPHFDPNSKQWKKQAKFANYTSASLVTRGKQDWQFGRIEVRAKLPQGLGVWPAIWTLGSKYGAGLYWPRCGEIDIMEYVGKEPNHIYANFHYQLNGKHRSHMGKTSFKAPYQDFHIYALEWFRDRLDFYFDDKKYHSFNIKHAQDGEFNPLHMRHYLLINLALGGSWGGEIDDANLPQQYLIDYVRVYQQANEQEQSQP